MNADQHFPKNRPGSRPAGRRATRLTGAIERFLTHRRVRKAIREVPRELKGPYRPAGELKGPRRPAADRARSEDRLGLPGPRLIKEQGGAAGTSPTPDTELPLWLIRDLGQNVVAYYWYYQDEYAEESDWLKRARRDAIAGTIRHYQATHQRPGVPLVTHKQLTGLLNRTLNRHNAYQAKARDGQVDGVRVGPVNQLDRAVLEATWQAEAPGQVAQRDAYNQSRQGRRAARRSVPWRIRASEELRSATRQLTPAGQRSGRRGRAEGRSR